MIEPEEYRHVPTYELISEMGREFDHLQQLRSTTYKRECTKRIREIYATLGIRFSLVLPEDAETMPGKTGS